MREKPVFHKTSETFVSGSMTLPQEYYTSEEIFSKEQERILKKDWTCAGHISRIPNPGDYFLLNRDDESIIVLRDKNGGVNSFHNVCRHRGTRICEDGEGHFGKSIQCSYHAWTYNLEGKLLGAPFMNEIPGFNKEDYPLKEAETHLWEGFIFVNPGMGKLISFEEKYPELPELSQWNMGPLRFHKRVTYDVNSNWKYIFQNFNECYHCPPVHPQLARIADYTSGNNNFTEGTVLGGFMEFKGDTESMTMTGRACALPLGNLSKEESKRGYYYSVLPNLLLNVHPDYVMFHLVLPEAPNRTKVISEWLFSPESSNQPDFNPQDAVDFWDATNLQDWKMCELGQLGVSSQAYRPGPYSSRESLLAAFDRHYLKLME